jgi:hypothetical protein
MIYIILKELGDKRFCWQGVGEARCFFNISFGLLKHKHKKHCDAHQLPRIQLAAIAVTGLYLCFIFKRGFTKANVFLWNIFA